jgi:hypothetical protein
MNKNQKHIDQTKSKASLKAALDANRQLQAEITKQLEQIQERKSQNRRASARCIEQVAQARNIEDAKDNATPSTPTSKQVQALFPSNDEPKMSHAKKRQFHHDPSRKWNLEYFLDPTGSRPNPNDDVAKRRKLEQESPCFYHLSPTWTKPEIKAITEITSEQGNDAAIAIDIDFEQVSQRLYKQTKGDKSLPITAVPRTAKECELLHQHLSLGAAKQPPFTKEESLQLLEQVHGAEDEKEPPDWKTIATSLKSNSNRMRTAWECFVHYKQSLQTKPTGASGTSGNTTTSSEQDELLLRYIALNGPQFVWDTQAAAHVSSRLFSGMMPKQLLNKSNQTVANPNFTTEYWTKVPERKLVLAMKAYHGYNTDDKNQPSALSMASSHFPDRASQQVSHKWERSLDPGLDQSPFSPEEDARLVDAVRQSQGDGFAEIARQHFPQRRGHQVYQRFAGAASTDDLVMKFGESTLLRQQGSKPSSGLSAEDFRLEWTKKEENNNERTGS